MIQRSGGLKSDRFEHHVETAARAEGGEQSGEVERAWAKVMKDNPARIEQDLDVDQLDRPVEAFHDVPAGREVVGALEVGPKAAFEVAGAGGAEDHGRGRRG
ncbi:MAG: hypothetical protein JO329_05090 [Planctomycetaceae bacterium]|nr:hypothetical protein [Planctomycetaceae bacterium]